MLPCRPCSARLSGAPGFGSFLGGARSSDCTPLFDRFCGGTGGIFVMAVLLSGINAPARRMFWSGAAGCRELYWSPPIVLSKENYMDRIEAPKRADQFANETELS